MHIIKLNAIGSTNTYLRKLISTGTLKDFTVVLTDKQTDGRGQVGTVWSSQEGKNLTTSVFKDTKGFYVNSPFDISMITTLSLIKTLEHFLIPKLKIKWPNDILSENKKICGILIENVIKKNKLIASVIGIGLNINQTEFKDLPLASSMRLQSGKTFDINEVLRVLVDNLKMYFNRLIDNDFDDLKEEYEKHLFRKNKPSTFKDIEGDLFTGIIKNVSNSGNLQVLIEDDIIKEFEMKELTLLY